VTAGSGSVGSGWAGGGSDGVPVGVATAVTSPLDSVLLGIPSPPTPPSGGPTTPSVSCSLTGGGAPSSVALSIGGAAGSLGSGAGASVAGEAGAGADRTVAVAAPVAGW
jgi:hypothetical protein